MVGPRERGGIGGWLRSLVGAAIVFAIGLYLGFGLTLFGGLPREAIEPAAAFAIVFTTAFTAGRLAPRARFHVAIAAAGLACAIGHAVALSAIGSAVGALTAIGIASGWSIDGELAPRLRRGLRLVGLAAPIAFAVFVWSRYVDWPARPDPLPTWLQEALGADAARVRACYATDLGGFLDREALWRIEADEAVLDVLVGKLALEPVAEAPEAFFRMPPRDWLRALPPAGRAHASPGFRSGSRGGDGDHYLLVRDGAGRAFVWEKRNF
ncbi:MAG: hypothetical protein U0900_21440 [Myxococcota bacterium]